MDAFANVADAVSAPARRADCMPIAAGGAPAPGRGASQEPVASELRALALELLEPDDRNVILWREYEDQPFAVIAERLGMAEDAARMRFARALPKLAKKLQGLRAGELGSLLDGA